jgi:hypothetical protein
MSSIQSTFSASVFKAHFLVLSHLHLSPPGALQFKILYAFFASRMCGMIYIYLTAIGLTPGGSSTAHIYTQTMHIIQRKDHILQYKQLCNLGSKDRASSLRVTPWHLPYN